MSGSFPTTPEGTPRRAKSAEAIGTIYELQGRCVIDHDTGCWHLRTAYGRPQRQGALPRVWVHGVGTMTATRAAYELSTHQPLPEGKVVYRCCGSSDCIAPKHLRLGSRRQMMASYSRKGLLRGNPARSAINRRNVASITKLTPELRLWLIESPQSGVDAAHGLGVTQSRANTIRAEHRAMVRNAAPSVFAWAESHLSDPAARARVSRGAAIVAGGAA